MKNNNSSYEVIVVDQNSTDGSQISIKNNFPDIKLFCSETNLGVAGGRNKGAELAKGNVLVFIDDDSHFVTEESILKIEKLFKSCSKIGIIGFKVVDRNNNIRDWVYHKNTKKYYNETFETQQYVGCGHAIRSDLFHRVQGYSNDLFFWGEEIEFCIKTFIYSDLKIIYYPHITVQHRVSDNSRLYWSDKRTYYQARNRFVLIKTYFNNHFIAKTFYLFYFGFGYFIKAIRNSALKYYFTGLIDSRKINIKLINEINRKDVDRYFKLHLKQIFGRVNVINGKSIKS